MSNNVNISSSGGSLSLGSIVQGDRNDVHVRNSQTIRDEAFKKAEADLQALGEHRPQKERAEVRQALEALNSESKTSEPALSKGAAILKTIRENFQWAYPALKDFISIAWPALFSLTR